MKAGCFTAIATPFTDDGSVDAGQWLGVYIMLKDSDEIIWSSENDPFVE